jgi:type II secretory pathway component PulF
MAIGSGFGAAARAHIYNEFAKLVGAGFGIDKAAEAVLAQNPPRGLAAFAGSVKDGLDAGKSIAESVADAPLPISPLESRLIAAAEKGGRVEDGFAHLAHYFEIVDRNAQRIRTGLVYPVILLHLAVVLPAIPAAVAGGGWRGFATTVAVQLVVLYIAAAIGAVVFRRLAARAQTDPAPDRLLNRIPLVGAARRNSALSRFCKVFEIFVLAGQRTSEATSAAGQASGSGVLQAASHRVESSLADGNPLGPELLAYPEAFPNPLARSLATAEESGTLEKDLHRWASLFQTNADEAMTRLSDWGTKLIYAFAVIFVAWQVIRLFTGYLGYLNSAANTI